MRRWSTLVLFLAGMVVGGLALRPALERHPNGWLRWRHGFTPSREEGFPPTPIWVAAADLPAHTVLTQAMLEERGIPDQFTFDGMARREQLPAMLGLPLRRPVVSGEPLLFSAVARPGSVAALCGQLTAAANAHREDESRAQIEALRKALNARSAAPRRP